jgi:hypothetical protein
MNISSQLSRVINIDLFINQEIPVIKSGVFSTAFRSIEVEISTPINIEGGFDSMAVPGLVSGAVGAANFSGSIEGFG